MKMMMGTMACIYETPCGWCSRLDKQCDRGRGAKCRPKNFTKDEACPVINRILNNKAISSSDVKQDLSGLIERNSL